VQRTVIQPVVQRTVIQPVEKPVIRQQVVKKPISRKLVKVEQVQELKPVYREVYEETPSYQMPTTPFVKRYYSNTASSPWFNRTFQ
jgi:hypothetical protein